MTIAVGGGMSVVHPLPPEGVDLRAELRAHQRSRVEQALVRAAEDPALAAKLLRITPLELAGLREGMGEAAPPPPPPSPPRPPAQAAARARRVAPPSDEMPRVERGVEVISRAAIRRLEAEGRTPKQIAGRLGVNLFVVEKVLREAELAKCGPRRGPGGKP